MGRTDFRISKSRFLKLLMRSWLRHKTLMFLVIFCTLITVCCYVINIKVIQWMTSIMMSKNIVDLMNDVLKGDNDYQKLKHLCDIIGIGDDEMNKFIEQISKSSTIQKQIALENVVHQFFFTYVDYSGLDSDGASIVYISIFELKMTLTKWCFFMVFNVDVIMIFTYLAYIFSGIIAQKEENRLRNHLIVKLANQDIHFFNNAKIGNLINVVVSDTEKIGKQLKTAPIIIVQVIATTLGSIGVMLSIDWKLCTIILILLISVLIVVIIILRATKRATEHINDIQNDINSEIAEKLYTMKLVKSSGTWDSEKHHYRVLNKEVEKYDKINLIFKEIVTALLIGAIGCFVMSSIVFGVFMYSSDVQVLIGKMTAFTTGVLVMTLPFMQLNEIAGSINEAEASVVAYENLADSEIFINKVGGKKIIGFSNYIELKNVSFAFPDAPNDLYVRNLNMVLEKGKKYAFVGESGCGKSTIVKLLLRFYDPISGQIRINYTGRLQEANVNNWLEELNRYSDNVKKVEKGIVIKTNTKKSLSLTHINVRKNNIKDSYDYEEAKTNSRMINLKDLELSSWLQRVGYIAQEPQILSGTFWENVRYSKQEATDKEVIEACKKAKLHEFIMSLPQQYDTKLSEQGSQLSGGQKQRIVIARTFLKNPEILLLDEATSALDNVSEALIQEELDKLMIGKTTVSIAHRLNTIKDFDKIYVLAPKKGIIQEGTFNELISQEGIFRNLYKHQTMEQKG